MENLTQTALSKRHKTTMKVSARNYIWTALLVGWGREREILCRYWDGIHIYSIMLNSAERVEEQEEL